MTIIFYSQQIQKFELQNKCGKKIRLTVSFLNSSLNQQPDALHSSATYFLLVKDGHVEALIQVLLQALQLSPVNYLSTTTPYSTMSNISAWHNGSIRPTHTKRLYYTTVKTKLQPLLQLHLNCNIKIIKQLLGLK